MAIINIRLSEIETKNALLQAKKIESASVYQAFFNEKYNNDGRSIGIARGGVAIGKRF